MADVFNLFLLWIFTNFSSTTLPAGVTAPIIGTLLENLDEIEVYRLELGIPKDKTYVIPAGDTREQLIKMYPLVFEMVAEHGYNMTGRDHIIAYDTERGV